MIVVNKKANITHLPYNLNNRKGIISLNPGQNSVDPRIWHAAKKEVGEERMAYYNEFLKPIGEEDPDQPIDPAKLNADEFIDLISGAMNLELLDSYVEAESGRKGGARKTVMEAIERQAEDIREIEENKANNEE